MAGHGDDMYANRYTIGNARNYGESPQSQHSNTRSNNNQQNDTPVDTDTRHSTESRTGRKRSVGTQGTNERSRSRTNGSTGKSSTGNLRICKKCSEPLTGQFVRALGGTFHLDCFKCQDCGEIVASKFFPVEEEDGSGQFPLCERDYFRRLDLLCFSCGSALRGSYITALDRKYHIEHFTCSVCPTVFGAQDSYYEHDAKVYCHYHYSTQFAQRCNGCQTAILKQFVEIFRNGQNQHWHPECYMIHKFWNVRLATGGDTSTRPGIEEKVTEEQRDMVKQEEEKMEDKVYRIWSTLSTFEESSASCISDMLLHVSNGVYMDGVIVARKFITHVDILFAAIDSLATLIAAAELKELAYGREAKLLCKKVVAFFTLLSKTQETGVRKLGVTQELLSLVTGLAHYLKLLIRIGLQGALKLEREKGTMKGLHVFLDQLAEMDLVKDMDSGLELTDNIAGLANQESDCCAACHDPIDDECVMSSDMRWHVKPPHLTCNVCGKNLAHDISNATFSQADGKVYCLAHSRRGDNNTDFDYVTKLQQYVFLLKVALARLLEVLKSGGTLPHTSDDPNLTPYNAAEGHRLQLTDRRQTASQRMGPRSRSYAGASRDMSQETSLEQTVGEMRRLRSKRNERTLSMTARKPRTSRILDGPEGLRPGSAGADGNEKQGGFHIVEERDIDGRMKTELTFGNQDGLTLDDIPRIVAAEQAKEQRPNAYRHAGQNLLGHRSDAPKLVNGHQRSQSGNDVLTGEAGTMRIKRYFSELSALEYFIVRHVAVLSMQPLLEGYFTLEELLSLIESRKPTFWGKVSRALRNDNKTKKKGIFGVALETLCEREGADTEYGVGPGQLRVPNLIDEAVSAMRQMDMSVEGVFRKNGNIKRLKETAEAIDAGQMPDLNRENPVQIAALLKKFLREMPEPLMTQKLHKLFIVAQKIDNDEKRRRVLHLTCCLMPKSHRDTMEVLFSFLKWAASFSQVDEESGSKMDVHNLATVVAPNILYAKDKTQNSKAVQVPQVDESFLAIETVNTLIEYNDAFCEVPEDLQSILTDSSLHNGSADLTTKEILSRYGDIVKGNVQLTSRTVQGPDGPPRGQLSGSGSQRSTGPMATRVEVNPHQTTARQKESSARPDANMAVGSGNPKYDFGPSLTGPQGHQQDFNLGVPSSPYARERQGSGSSYSESHGSHGGSTRQSFQPKPGTLGVSH